MAKLGSKSNPLILNVHSEAKLKYVVQICEKNDWYYLCGINPQDPENFEDLERKLYPPTIQWENEKVGRNEICPCGSGKKFKKCCWDQAQQAEALELKKCQLSAPV